MARRIAKRSEKLSGITVRCVYCKTVKTIPFDEAREMPFCDKDGGPMVAISARI